MPKLFFYLILSVFLLQGCASQTKTGLKVHHINTLASPENNTGGFKGLEFLADPVPDESKNRVIIIYLHGIGWTEDRNSGQLAEDFLSGIAKAYDLTQQTALSQRFAGKRLMIPRRSLRRIFISRPIKNVVLKPHCLARSSNLTSWSVWTSKPWPSMTI